MQYIAHKSDDGRIQSVKNHLIGTADLAKAFSLEFCKELAYYIGLMHDIGKYSEQFQRRINGDTVKVEHAICGAKEVDLLFSKEFFAPLLKYCIAGHHTGLPDGGSDADLSDTSTLCGRMKRETYDYSKYKTEISPIIPDCEKIENLFLPLIKDKNIKEITELYVFLTKYLFSCLTDADFIDTEVFCNIYAERGTNGDFKSALELLNKTLNSFLPDTEVKKARALLQSQAISRLSVSKEINILNMPTGSGKTLCSIKIALEQAIATGKKHIIYVIPYTSIIEQTSITFEKIFGNALPILEHHSNHTFEIENNDDTTAQKLKRTCENWDAPLIVTTSVQFFQSLYHYRGSRLRKLHNLADSIIIFDEIHLIPIEYLQPCLRAIGYITKLLNSKAIFLSATMPDYTTLFSTYLPDNEICEFISDKTCFSAFRNCTYLNLGMIDFESAVEKAAEYNSSLIIVNSRQSAQLVYSIINDKNGKKFHLSTYMTPTHRSRIIAMIKECLKGGDKITVVSTSLVEAGVDFDFETVFRQMAGLDSILQSGGRCNREGNRSNGFVYVFETDEKAKGDLQIRSNITADILKKYPDISCQESIFDYYNRLFTFNNKKIKQNSITEFAGNISLKSIPFRSYAQNFDYIKSDTISIVINLSAEINNLIERLKFGDRSVIRKLQRHSVSVYFYEFENIKKLGIISEIDGIFILENNDYYTEEKGLYWKDCFDKKYII